MFLLGIYALLMDRNKREEEFPRLTTLSSTTESTSKSGIHLFLPSQLPQLTGYTPLAFLFPDRPSALFPSCTFILHIN